MMKHVVRLVRCIPYLHPLCMKYWPQYRQYYHQRLRMLLYTFFKYLVKNLDQEAWEKCWTPYDYDFIKGVSLNEPLRSRKTI